VLSFVGLKVPLASGPPSGRYVAPVSLNVIVSVPVAPPLPPTSEKIIKLAPVGPTSSISMSSGRPLRWKLFRVRVTLVVDVPRPEATTVLGYGTEGASLNVTGPPRNFPGGSGVPVGAGVGVGVGVGAGVGVAAVAVISRLQLVIDPVSPPLPCVSSLT
jgi:hypothetical protein